MNMNFMVASNPSPMTGGYEVLQEHLYERHYI